MGHVHSPHKIAEQLLFSLHLNHTLDSLQDNIASLESENVLSFLNLFHRTNLVTHCLLCSRWYLLPYYSWRNDTRINWQLPTRSTWFQSNLLPRNNPSFSKIWLISVWWKLGAQFILWTLAAIKLFSPSGSNSWCTHSSELSIPKSTWCFYYSS